MRDYDTRLRGGARERPRVFAPTGGVARTKQSFKAECDINNIMAKFGRTGAVAHVNRYSGRYGLFAPIDFRDAMETVRQASEMFDALPAKLRARFSNDPAVFLEFVQDKENLPELRKLGLAMAEKPAPVPAAAGSGGGPGASAPGAAIASPAPAQ